jgi:hypothetical protein
LCCARAQIKTLSAVFVEKENRIHEKEETNKKIKSECDARAATLSELEQKLEKARAPSPLLATGCVWCYCTEKARLQSRTEVAEALDLVNKQRAEAAEMEKRMNALAAANDGVRAHYEQEVVAARALTPHVLTQRNHRYHCVACGPVGNAECVGEGGRNAQTLLTTRRHSTGEEAAHRAAEEGRLVSVVSRSPCRPSRSPHAKLSGRGSSRVQLIPQRYEAR